MKNYAIEVENLRKEFEKKEKTPPFWKKTNKKK